MSFNKYRRGTPVTGVTESFPLLFSESLPVPKGRRVSTIRRGTPELGSGDSRPGEPGTLLLGVIFSN